VKLDWPLHGLKRLVERYIQAIGDLLERKMTGNKSSNNEKVEVERRSTNNNTSKKPAQTASIKRKHQQSLDRVNNVLSTWMKCSIQLKFGAEKGSRVRSPHRALKVAINLTHANHVLLGSKSVKLTGGQAKQFIDNAKNIAAELSDILPIEAIDIMMAMVDFFTTIRNQLGKEITPEYIEEYAHAFFFIFFNFLIFFIPGSEQAANASVNGMMFFLSVLETGTQRLRRYCGSPSKTP
jgi:hypothetical protein